MPPDPGSCESPAPAAAPPPAALAMTSAGTASAAPRRLRRLGPTPGQLPHAWPPPRRLTPDRHARPQRDRQERRRTRLRHRHPPSPVCQSNRKIPRDAPEAGGRFGRTAHPPAVTSPGTHHPKPGALGAGGTAASSDKSSRKKLKSRRVLPSLAATPRNEKIRSFLGSEKKRKKKIILKQASSAMTGKGTSPLTVMPPRSRLQPPAATRCWHGTGCCPGHGGEAPLPLPPRVTAGWLAKPRCSEAVVSRHPRGRGTRQEPGE